MALVYLIGKWQGRDFFADYGWIIADWQFFTIILENCKSVKTTLLQYYFVNLYNDREGKVMAKKNIETENEVAPPFTRFKSYSVEEILAAGGAIAFADKLGKNARTLYEGLKSLPKDVFLTEEEAQQALDTLRASK
ncbi:MAG: hypothetical protein V4577_15045 [Bacteroidota bacterium]